MTSFLGNHILCFTVAINPASCFSFPYCWWLPLPCTFFKTKKIVLILCPVLSRSVMSDSCNPMGCSQPGSSVHGDSSGKNTGGGCHAPPGDLPNPGIKPMFPTLQVDSLLSEPPGKPKNTGVGSLSLLQGIFLTQESNKGLLHYRWIIYQLSYQGSPLIFYY